MLNVTLYERKSQPPTDARWRQGVVKFVKY